MNASPMSTTAAGTPPLIEDGALVAQVLAGDHAAFELLMRRYNQRLYRATYSILSDAQAAEDCMQEAYISAFHALGDWRKPHQFGAWLTRIAINQALMQRRGQRRLSVVEPQEAARLADVQQEAEMPSDPHSGQDPQHQAANLQLRAGIEAAVLELPETFRCVFILRAVEQLSVAETAMLLDIPEATVKTRLHRARALLRERLERQLDAHCGELFEFAGYRCDRLVQAVLARLSN